MKFDSTNHKLYPEDVSLGKMTDKTKPASTNSLSFTIDNILSSESKASPPSLDVPENNPHVSNGALTLAERLAGKTANERAFVGHLLL